MEIRAIIILATLACTAEAFTVPSRSVAIAKKPSSTALALELPVDPLVLAAAGLAVVGGIGTVILTSKIQKIDESEGTTAPASTSSAPAASPAASSSSVDVSIPYDAAARLAYEKAGSKGDYGEFKAKYEADAVADVKAKQ